MYYKIKNKRVEKYIKVYNTKTNLIKKYIYILEVFGWGANDFFEKSFSIENIF